MRWLNGKKVRHSEIELFSWNNNDIKKINDDINSLIRNIETTKSLELINISVSDIPELRGLALEFKESSDCSNRSAVQFISPSSDVKERINKEIIAFERGGFEFESWLPCNYPGMSGIFLVFNKV